MPGARLMITVCTAADRAGIVTVEVGACTPGRNEAATPAGRLPKEKTKLPSDPVVLNAETT